MGRRLRSQPTKRRIANLVATEEQRFPAQMKVLEKGRIVVQGDNVTVENWRFDAEGKPSTLSGEELVAELRERFPETVEQT